ncbi:SMC-Scp complex subunit ScpB [bacterium]|nr:SMC-Scp complex subunit ScpB [bacterium]
MKNKLEALLFATDTPLTIAKLKSIITDAESKEIRTAINELTEEYKQQGRAFSIVEFGGGWQLATCPEYIDIVQKLYRGRRFIRLSKAALEVLAIIAYRQPVTRLEGEDIRGVQVSGVLSTLVERGLINVVGRSDAIGNPILYGTTREFLNYMGLNGLHQLPSLPELEEVADDRDRLNDFARQLGEVVTDEDFETISIQGDEIIYAAIASEDATTEENEQQDAESEPAE